MRERWGNEVVGMEKGCTEGWSRNIDEEHVEMDIEG